MQMTHLIPCALIAAAILAGKTGTSWADSATASPEWRIERGWLVRDDTAQPGEGFAANVHIAEIGRVLDAARTPHIETGASSYGGFETVYTTEHGTLIDRCIPFPELGQRAWRRSLHYTNTSDSVQDLLSTEMRIAPITTHDSQHWQPPFFRMTNTPSGRSLCFSYWSEAEPYTVTDGRVEIISQWRLAPGDEATIGQMSIWLGRPGPSGFPVEARRWFRAHGFPKPLTYPEWLSRGVLYEASAAGHVDARFSDVGGFSAFGEQVDYLADLGVSVLWLNAVHAHKRPPNPTDGMWNHYDPLDFDVVDPILGGSDGLRGLVDQLEDAGIHILCETVPHGGHSKQAEALEAWWTRERDGEPRRNWGGYGMDNASPEWQAVIGGHMAMLAREFGIEGARIDVADGQGPNWGSPRTNHASYSTIGGGIEMLRAIRDGIAQGPANIPVLIPESPLRREYFTIEDAFVVGYGFEFTNCIRDNVDLARTEPARMVEVLRGLLETERATLPPGAIVIRTLNNHDTVVERGRVMDRFGAGLARAFYGVCVAVPGLPMMYQEEETGNFGALRRMNWTRRLLPELGAGEAVYLEPGYFAPEVFAVLRKDAHNQTIVLVNLSGVRQTGRAEMPEDVDDETVVYDAAAAVLREKVRNAYVRDHTIEWTLEPYETTFLRIGSPPEDHIPAARFAAKDDGALYARETLEWRVDETGLTARSGGVKAQLTLPGMNWQSSTPQPGVTLLTSPAGSIEVHETLVEVDVTCDIAPEFAHNPLVLHLSRAKRWTISGESAVLDDWFVTRRWRFPEGSDYVWRRTDVWGYLPHQVYNRVLPAERLWQSIFEPLHGKGPAAAFLDDDSRGLSLINIRTDAMNVVLTDGSEPDRRTTSDVALLFFAVDGDLHPQIQHFGHAQPWIVPGLEAVPARPLRVSFTFSDAAAANMDFAKSRSALTPSQPVEEREGEQFSDFFRAIFMPEPGAVTWRNLAAVPGTFQIQFELRHSERGPEDTGLCDAYVVEINGITAPLDWVALNTASTGNAYFGHAQTKPFDLSNGPHTITIRTKRPWCAVRRGFRLIPATPAE